MFTRKILCLLLGLLLTASLTVNAFAAPVEGTGSTDSAKTTLAALPGTDVKLTDSQLTLAEALGQITDEIAKSAYIEALLQEYDGVEIHCNDCVNVWAEMKKDDSLLTLRNGKVAHLEAIEDGWYKITFGKTTGYVDATYADLVHYEDYEDTSAVSTIREELTAYAMEWLGTRYRYGGSSKKGTDCSGFTMAVFKEFGYTLTHGASDQQRASRSVTAAERDVGDLVFFSFYGSGATHVGIYLGGGNFIHASTSQGVIVSSLSEKYYANGYCGAGRILPD